MGKTVAQEKALTTTRPEDTALDSILRPRALEEFIGQAEIKRALGIVLAAARKRKEACDHLLFAGPPGLGKTTIAMIVARELGVNIRVTSGPAIERVGDLGAILTNLQDCDVLFIDELHRLPRVVEEVLYPAMEAYALDVVVGQGAGAKTVRLNLPRFTLIGATTRIGLLSAPLRDRFGSIFRLRFYTTEDIEAILARSARLLKVNLTAEGRRTLATCARATPRIANRLLKRVRDLADVRGKKWIGKDLVQEALEIMEVDARGLDATDRRVLRVIAEKFGGGPVGLNTLAAATAEEAETIEEVVEPYLLQIGFLERTPRGRRMTSAAFKHLGLTPPSAEEKLL